jgi:hypothetical protein
LSALTAFSSTRLSWTTSLLPPVPSGFHNQQDHVAPLPKQPKAHHHHHLQHRRSRTATEKAQDPLALTSHAESVLFLRVFAAADYFTANTSLMQTVPPVLADIILDPFLLNVFPRSLVPPALWILVVAAVAWFISGWIAKALYGIISSAVAADDDGKEREKKKQEDSKKKR